MANFGMFAGGLADALGQGMERNQRAQFQQQELKLQQQSQEAAQKRFEMARHDKLAEDLWSSIQNAVEQARIVHPEDADKRVMPAIQGMFEQYRKFTTSIGYPGLADAKMASLWAKPSYGDIMGGNPYPARSAGTPTTPGGGGRGNTFAPGEDITGTQTQEIPAGARLPVGGGQQDDVDRLTRALGITDNPGLKTALAARLQDALRQRGDNTEVKTIKDENQNEHILFVDKRKRSITDQNGNPWVSPSGDDSDSARIATAIKEGRQPPVTTGLYKNAKGVRAELERQGFDLSAAQLEWDAAKKQISSLNGPQMVKFAGLAKSVDRTIDEVRDLAKQMNNSGIPIANAVKLQAYIQTAGNSESGQLAARYIAAVNTLKEEFTSLAAGGYAPTEAAWALANQQIQGNYGVLELGASLTEVQRLIRYRLQGIPNFEKLGPGAGNRYVGGGGQQSEQPGAPAVDPSKLTDDDLRKRLGIQ